mmetsp:Transcript_26898/g.38601  ORF Transcript_26898/g.38601 Transcript_26898/m.38601 type:complete len:241 (-) Transcript_26898:744-1466(-)|eukprot:CAMPEP_0172420108 /NCGR_PEP_ID=MMETSP1064-20121228/6517_1 /TAXON_ID=202472 /ORGANISM="Aulacoseira subarctica , Strain CCAP 1002/5" /LENGTH=240 /DNA_ID=CAMNT_0013159923 /DNA_START=119 /DNA_END=841 /DNA_ORIENTATION=+
MSVRCYLFLLLLHLVLSNALGLVRSNFIIRHQLGKILSHHQTATYRLVLSASLNENDDDDALLLQQRIQQVREKALREQVGQPPNPNLTPVEFVTRVLDALKNNMDDPLPDFGCIVLLRSSTPSWKREILKSIGAPTWANEAQVAAALNNALTRPRNQFHLLVEDYALQFPSDVVEDGDDSWVECRLRHVDTGALLAVTGWNLKKRKQDGSWLIDNLDWQDFRDEYRPGIGREEWIRVFG